MNALAARCSLAAALAAAALAPAFAQASAPSRSEPMAPAARPSKATERFPRERLVPLLKPALGAWKRVSLRSARLPQDDPATPPVEAGYEGPAGRASVALTVVAPGPAWTGEPVERTIDGGTEKLWRWNQRPTREARYEQPPRQVVTVTLANGIVLTAASPTADAAALRELLAAVDLDAAERLRPGAR